MCAHKQSCWHPEGVFDRTKQAANDEEGGAAKNMTAPKPFRVTQRKRDLKRFLIARLLC